MSTDTLNPLPETSAEKLRYETAQRAEQNYKRLRLFRTAVVVSALAALTTRVAFTVLLAPPSDPLLSTPALIGIALVASGFAMVAVKSARSHRDICRSNYEDYLARSRESLRA